VDFITKEKTDPMRPVNMFVQNLVEVDEGAESFKEIKFYFN